MDKSNIKYICDLSPMQQGMLFTAIYNPDSDAYNIRNKYKIMGKLDVDLLTNAVNEVVDRHDALRTAFVFQSTTRPKQVIFKKRPIKVLYEEISSLDDNSQKERIQALEQNQRNFDLAKDTLLKIQLVKLNTSAYYLYFNFHHIILDGWSVSIVMNEILSLYRAKLNGRALILPKAKSFKLYTDWLSQQKYQDGVDFWKNELEKYDNVLSLPGELSFGNGEFYEQGIHSYQIKYELRQKIIDYLTGKNITLNIFFQACWAILLSRYNSVKDVVFGVVTSGRTPNIEGIEGIVGLFINTIPIRLKINDSSFSDFLIEVYRKFQNANQNASLPLAEILKQTSLKQSLLNHIFVFENYPTLTNSNEKENQLGFTLTSESNYERTSYDFDFIIDAGDKIFIKIRYNKHVYQLEYIQNIEEHLNAIIEQVINDEQLRIDEIDIITPNEKNFILNCFNNTNEKYNDENLLNIFCKKVEETPNSIAIVDKDKNISYKVFWEKTNSILELIVQSNTDTNEIIPVLLERSADIILAFWAIQKASCCYLPISPDLPPKRVRAMLKDIGAKKVLSTKEIFVKHNLDIPLLDIENTSLSKNFRISSSAPIQNRIAYGIYTSGSTGMPKCALISEKALLNRILWMQKQYQLTSDDIILHKTPNSFDVSVWELVWWVFSGSCVVILPYGFEKEPSKVELYLEKYKCTVVHFVPSMFDIFLDTISQRNDPLKRIKYIFSSGETLRKELVNKYFKITSNGRNTQLINLYGPTEATVDVSYYACTNSEIHTIPIGKPIDNINLYVFDEYMNLQPFGVCGELYISGIGVSIGYLNRPDMTFDSFMVDPFNTELPMYRTGDIVILNKEGLIEFVERKDNQIKLYGNRIELDEMEIIAKSSPLVENCKIIINNKTNAITFFHIGKEVEKDAIHKYLSQELPAYMVPSIYINIEKLPYTLSGKLDQKRLQELADEYNENSCPDAGQLLPETRSEELMYDIWMEILDKKEFSVESNFFLVGGDSIKGIQILGKLNRLGYELSLKDLFDYPTIRSLAPRIRELKSKGSTSSRYYGEFGLSPIQIDFLKRKQNNHNQYSQYVFIKLNNNYSAENIKDILKTIVDSHDAFRVEYIQRNEQVTQKINKTITDTWFIAINFNKKVQTIDDVNHLLEKANNEIDVFNSAMFRIVYIRATNASFLYFIAHHLIIDTLSWRIILEELEIVLSEYDKKGKLIARNNSFDLHRWISELTAYYKNGQRSREYSYWEQHASKNYDKIPYDFFEYQNQLKDTANTNLQISEKETNILLTKANEKYNTRISELLISAICLALKSKFAISNIGIDFEGHGREDVFDGIELAQAIGWFTTLYPVLFELSDTENQEDTVITIKETLRRVPNKGIGYGIYKFYGSGDNKSMQKPQIQFNYLGQLDYDLQKPTFGVIEKIGMVESFENERSHDIIITVQIINSKLELAFSYSQCLFRKETIIDLTNLIEEKLRSLIHLCSQGSARNTPSDFSYNQLDKDELDYLNQVFN